MVKTQWRFPDPKTADEHGIVCAGGEPSVENLKAAYAQGIFPWPHKGLPLLWFSPDPRGILFFNQFKIPRSTQKELKKKNYVVTVDRDFARVIERCAEQKRTGEAGTWITPEIIENYKQMHKLGWAHSFECWQEGELVGGMYGVFVKGVFSGESMFFTASGASKACLIYAVEFFKKMGLQWMDIQMVTSVLELFGGSYISRDEYLVFLKEAQKRNVVWRL